MTKATAVPNTIASEFVFNEPASSYLILLQQQQFLAKLIFGLKEKTTIEMQ
ncbi:MAG: hypothetical protein QM501_02610 [Gimesia sp.]